MIRNNEKNGKMKNSHKKKNRITIIVSLVYSENIRKKI